MNGLAKLAPWIAIALGALYLVGTLASGGAIYRNEEGFDFARYGRIPVVERGREKPLDTVARTYLMIVSSRQTFVEEVTQGAAPPQEVRQSAVKWFLDVATAGAEWQGPAAAHKVFRIENEEVLSYLGLEARPGFRYAVNEFAPKLNKEFFQRYESIRTKKRRDLFETKFFEFGNHFIQATQIASWETPLFIAPMRKGEEWRSFRDFAKDGIDPNNKVAFYHAKLLHAYSAGKADEFNATLDNFEKLLEQQLAEPYARAQFEVFFNKFAPFYQCIVLYIFVFLLACGSWLGWSHALNRSAFWLAVLTFVVHSWAIFARMYIQGRPPVTNLYSSAVFIGWGAVGVCIIIEWIYHNGVGSAAAAKVGALTLLVAHFLSLDGDTLEMLQAVLDTNFWLATHVTCITLGYTATFVAGTLGMAYVLLGVFTKVLAQRRLAFTNDAGLPEEIKVSGDVGNKITKMIYGVVCFAMFLSFTGTVLGGIWADQSWGRFWGWDPKENGALLIVIWNALLLHARWAGMVKARGLALLAVFGNCVTAWSWFGTNLLGVGLHAYGFMQGAMTWLLVYVLSQLAIIALGSMPLAYWRSFARAQTPQTVGPEGAEELAVAGNGAVGAAPERGAITVRR